MSYEVSVLLITAASIGFVHTLLGPDHYLPFIAMSQSGEWSLRRTAVVTFLCGIGHVLGSVLLGVIGVALGIAAIKLKIVESFRGDIAAWGLMTFGLIYFVWGLWRVVRNKSHQHFHTHKNLTPWILFTIFVFGPCEPLIPLLMYPAAKGSLFNLILVTTTFAVVTITTMMSIVLISSFGISFVPVSKLQRYAHALAGAAIFLCGVSIQFFGL
jgi:sulfite exporter TauE/SafE